MERTGRFSDDDYRELLAEYFAMESSFATHVHHLQTKLDRANEAIRDLQAIVRGLLEPVPEPAWLEEPDPFA